MKCPAQGATAPPPEGWQYWDEKAWHPDPSLRVVPLAGHRWCDQLSVTAGRTSKAARKHGSKMGRFLRTEDFSCGLPVSGEGGLLSSPYYAQHCIQSRDKKHTFV